ncbi:MAG: polymerase subunit gamma/tau [Chlamydiales bacterium]|jgi:DNA polymerase-3 subunit gamma/tau|nr:polymerase subunit gamma/tau [Chlamydiales bacterium]
MAVYQVAARRYRPQKFSEVIGQDVIVATLKNAIKSGQVAQGYLFAGSRGTGKTTLARVLAKALNCTQLTEQFEPCGLCSACREIASGHSLDVLEIDGASNRGIDDIRKISENVGYAASSGKYKIYIIDEVHMLTKEAFNALLKTLEEPPPQAKFFFATTEVHKVPATILSRCQRFQLKRISEEDIRKKLQRIAQEMQVPFEEEALLVLAKAAEGGLRDAESLFEQVIAFTAGHLSAERVVEALGLLPKERYFALDLAYEKGDLQFPFHLAEELFREGRDFQAFLEGLIEHFRTLLLFKTFPVPPYITLLEKERLIYQKNAAHYQKDTLLSIIEDLLHAEEAFRHHLFKKARIEFLLLKVIRKRYRVPIEEMVERLGLLEEQLLHALEGKGEEVPAAQAMALPAVQASDSITMIESVKTVEMAVDISYSQPDLLVSPAAKREREREMAPAPRREMAPGAPLPPSVAPAAAAEKPAASFSAMTAEERIESVKKQSRYDTLLQFTAVEFEGKVHKKRPR